MICGPEVSSIEETSSGGEPEETVTASGATDLAILLWSGGGGGSGLVGMPGVSVDALGVILIAWTAIPISIWCRDNIGTR